MMLAFVLGCVGVSLSIPVGPLSGVVPITLMGPEQPMELFVNGVSIGRGKGPEFVAEWDTTTVSDGMHVIRGESGELVALETVEVLGSFGDTTPPEIVFVSPESGRVRLPLRVEWRIAENHALSSVQLLDEDGILAELRPTPPWEVELAELSVGAHTLVILAEDETGNTDEASVEIDVR